MKHTPTEAEKEAVLDAVFTPLDMNRKQYEEDLAKRQREHLEQVHGGHEHDWQPCLHDHCTSCHGTGVRLDGSACVHMLSCPCPKCSPRC